MQDTTVIVSMIRSDTRMSVICHQNHFCCCYFLMSVIRHQYIIIVAVIVIMIKIEFNVSIILLLVALLLRSRTIDGWTLVSSSSTLLSSATQTKQQKNFVLNKVCCYASSVFDEDNSCHDETRSGSCETTYSKSYRTFSRRNLFLQTMMMMTILSTTPNAAVSVNTGADTISDTNDLNSLRSNYPIEIVPSNKDVQKLFNEGRIYETQGNINAAYRIYNKIVQLQPNFVYGHSNLGNAQTIVGDLKGAEQSYTTAINLCNEFDVQQEQRRLENNNNKQFFGERQRGCTDLYVLYLNRGCIRLNTLGQAKNALSDLQQANALRARPDSILLQNLARAQELNSEYDNANSNYDIAIQMTANEVSPFWIRSVLTKYQLNDIQGGFNLLKRINNRFPDVTEVKAAYATFLYKQNDTIGSKQLFLTIPNKQRLNYSNIQYLQQTVQWPPKMIDTVLLLAKEVGDL